MVKIEKQYRELAQELDEVLNQLQAENLDVDEAIELYERGLKLAQEMKQYLVKAENTIKKIKLEFDKP